MRTQLASLRRSVTLSAAVPVQCSCRCVRPLLAATKPQPACIQQRTFARSKILWKKKATAGDDETQAPAPVPRNRDDPFDFDELNANLEKIVERLKSDLSKLRAGGRFNPETVETLRVQPNKNETATYKLSDLASVVPKGRVLNIIVGEKDHVKPISSAISSSSLSLTPQPDPTGTNPLLLVINIPPPTAESRKAVVAEAAKIGEKASFGVREARGKQQKKQRAMEKARSALPDALHKASKEMEKVVEKSTAEVKKLIDNAKKVLESG